jgi:hypothetical protein
MAVLKTLESPFIFYNNCNNYDEKNFILNGTGGSNLTAENSAGALCESVVFPGKKSFNYNGESEFYSDEISLFSDFTFEAYLGGATGTTKTGTISVIGLSGLAHIQFLDVTKTFRIIVENAASAIVNDSNYFSFSKSGSKYRLQIQNKFLAYTQPAHFAIVRCSRLGRTFYFVNGVCAGSSKDNTTQPETFKIFIKSSVPAVSFVSEFISLRSGVINEINGVFDASFPVPAAPYFSAVPAVAPFLKFGKNAKLTTDTGAEITTDSGENINAAKSFILKFGKNGKLTTDTGAEITTDSGENITAAKSFILKLSK